MVVSKTRSMMALVYGENECMCAVPRSVQRLYPVRCVNRCEGWRPDGKENETCAQPAVVFCWFGPICPTRVIIIKDLKIVKSYGNDC